MLLKDKLLLIATQENAEMYAQTSEQFTFCIDLIGISAHREIADYWVNKLEDMFDDLLNPIHEVDSCVPTGGARPKG